MATRSTIKFYENYSEAPIATVYQQFDGYISGVGYGLANFLASKTIINGISGERMEQGFANGMGCLAAQFIAQNKTKIGGLYLVKPDSSEDYDYEVRYTENGFIIKVDDSEGTPEQLLAFNENSD